MSEPGADDKVQAVVGLVLQAVDQRLSTVRDQLIQLANTVNRGHAELDAKIEQIRQLATAAAQGAGSTPDAASTQLLEVANILTERVSTLEARMRQYTDDKFTELYESLDDIAPAPAPAPARAAPTTAAAADTAVAGRAAITLAATPTFTPAAATGLPDAVARLGTLSGAALDSRVDTQPPVQQPLVVQRRATDAILAQPDPLPLAQPGAEPLVAVSSFTATPAVDITPAEPGAALDIDSLSAQMSARLAALVDKALSI